VSTVQAKVPQVQVVVVQAQALILEVVARVISVARIALIHQEASIHRIWIRMRVRLIIIIIRRNINITRCPLPLFKSPASDRSRDTFEEWHSLWEVFGQDNGSNEYQSIVPHPDLPVNGHNTVKLVKTEKKALKKNKKAIASLRVSSSGVFTVDTMIEGTIDDAGVWPYGQIHLVLVDLYNTYRPKSQLDRIQ
jgi:hypothetical protein